MIERRKNTKDRRKLKREKAIKEFTANLQSHLKETIIESVNGKIEKSRQETKVEIGALKTEVVDLLNKQNEAIAPVIRTMENLRWGKGALMGIVGFLVAIGGLYMMAVKIFQPK